MMKTTLLAAIAFAETALLPLHAEMAGANGLAAVKSAGDAICTVSDSVAMSNGIAIVDKVMNWEEYDDEVARNGSLVNACSTDLSAFRDRGGKLIVLCGWEDQTTPSPETLAWYEMLAERNGGYDKTGKFCRLFALPGHAHGGGKGRIGTAGGYTIKHLHLLRKWVEEGKAPESYPQYWKEMNLTLPIPPYPFMCYQDDGGNWKTKRYPEGMVRRPDPAYMP